MGGFSYHHKIYHQPNPYIILWISSRRQPLRKEAPGERGMAAIAEHSTNEAQLTKAGEEWTAGQT